jgi:hypothetical protein
VTPEQEALLTPPERRRRLQACIAQLAVAIERGECEPQFEELKALAVVCDREHCHVEAARVRRWMGRSTS